VRRLYEGMFLIDSAEAAADWEGILGVIRGMLERAGAEIVTIGKWDECRLAYEINGKSRGTYILTYFKADSQKLGDIEKDVQLSERVMRVLILRADQMSESDIGKETPAMLAEKRISKAVEAREQQQAAVEQAKAEAEKAKAEADKAKAEGAGSPEKVAESDKADLVDAKAQADGAGSAEKTAGPAKEAEAEAKQADLPEKVAESDKADLVDAKAQADEAGLAGKVAESDKATEAEADETGSPEKVAESDKAGLSEKVTESDKAAGEDAEEAEQKEQ